MMDCDYCCGDEAIFYKDNENCAFVGMDGTMLVIVKDKSIQFKVDYCHMCGRKFRSATETNIYESIKMILKAQSGEEIDEATNGLDNQTLRDLIKMLVDRLTPINVKLNRINTSEE